MNMDPGPILLEDLRVSDVVSKKVTVRKLGGYKT